MIDINLGDMIAAAKRAEEDEAEKIAFAKIPGPPIKGLDKKTEGNADRKQERPPKEIKE